MVFSFVRAVRVPPGNATRPWQYALAAPDRKSRTRRASRSGADAPSSPWSAAKSTKKRTPGKSEGNFTRMPLAARGWTAAGRGDARGLRGDLGRFRDAVRHLPDTGVLLRSHVAGRAATGR